jgi:hypothetical protein
VEKLRATDSIYAAAASSTEKGDMCTTNIKPTYYVFGFDTLDKE